MGNANTDHSKALRRETARRYQNGLKAENRFAITHKDPAIIAAIRDGLNKIDGKNQAEKIVMLINFYLQNNQK